MAVAGSPDPVPANIGQCTSWQEQKGWTFAHERVSVLGGLESGRLSAGDLLTAKRVCTVVPSYSLPVPVSSAEKEFHRAHVSRAKKSRPLKLLSIVDRQRYRLPADYGDNLQSAL